MGNVPLSQVVQNPKKFREAMLLYQFSKALQKKSAAKCEFNTIPPEEIEKSELVSDSETVEGKKNLRRSSCFVFKIIRVDKKKCDTLQKEIDTETKN